MPSIRRVLIVILTAVVCHVLAISALAQKTEPPRDGVYQRFHPVGKYLTLEETYQNGQRHGPSRQFDKDGMTWEANYKDGKLDGYTRDYEKGNLASETFYKDGKAEGATFIVRGEFKSSGQFVEGKREGLLKIPVPFPLGNPATTRRDCSTGPGCERARTERMSCGSSTNRESWSARETTSKVSLICTK